jgi:predicted MPP superfamily phosphohydrolase
MAPINNRIRLMPRRRFIIAFAAVISLLSVQYCTTSDTSANRGTQRFRFIFASDVHYGESGNKIDSTTLANVLNEWKTKVFSWDFVVLAGDLTNDGDIGHMESLKNALDSLHKPYYTIIGNHDITTDTAENGIKNYISVFGRNRLTYLIMHKNVGLIFLDLSNGGKATVTVEVSTKLWLKKILANFPHKMPIIVFSHFPLHPETPRFAVMNSGELFQYLDKRNVLAYLSGHYHGQWFGLRNKIPFFTNVRLLPNVGPDHPYPESGYYVIDVFGSSVGAMFKRTSYTSPPRQQKKISGRSSSED